MTSLLHLSRDISYQTPSQFAKHRNTSELPLPVPRAFKPVQNVSAASVVNLIKGMWV